jgi:hypothetical protein
MLRYVAASRRLTYLDVDDEFATSSDTHAPSIPMIIGYTAVTIAFSAIAILIVHVSAACKYFYEWKAIRILLPTINIYLALKCATLAIDTSVTSIPSFWASTLYVLDAFVAPGILTFSFTLTFLAYRIRSMPFCCVHRSNETLLTDGYGSSLEVGPVAEEPLVQPRTLTWGMHIFCLCMLVCGLLVNFDVLRSESNLAGRTGWATVTGEHIGPHVVVALLPMALSICFCFYFALLLWRYGCEFSLTIHSSFLNPWMLPTTGVLVMAGGQLFGPDLYPIMSSLGICVYMTSMVRLLFEIRGDLTQSTDLGNFLGAVWTESDSSKRDGSIRAPTSSTSDSTSEPNNFSFSLFY